jgi:hypothetical protein
VDTQQVEPQQYEELARILVQQIASLIGRDGFVPPVDVSLTDADGHMVSVLQMDAYGDFRDLRDRDVPLQGRYPVTAAVSGQEREGMAQVFQCRGYSVSGVAVAPLLRISSTAERRLIEIVPTCSPTGTAESCFFTQVSSARPHCDYSVNAGTKLSRCDQIAGTTS